MSDLVNEAMDFAAQAHDGQFRKWSGKPYINHPKRVAGLVSVMGGSEEQIAAGWLHDVVEDCGVSIETIADQFGIVVGALVFELTKPSKPHTVQGCMVKLCDIYDNIRDLAQVAPDVFEAQEYVGKKFLQANDCAYWMRGEYPLLTTRLRLAFDDVQRALFERLNPSTTGEA